MGRFSLEAHGAVYLRMPDAHPGDKSAKQIKLHEIWPGPYKGPLVIFDLDAAGALIGIEVVDDDDE